MEPLLSGPDWRFSSKWPGEIIELGYTMVPNALLYYYDFLNITPSEFLLLVNIESYRWDANKFPFPSVETLAQRTGLAPRSITRIITTLEKEKRLVRRIKRKHTSNQYNFDPLTYRLLEVIRYDKDGSLGGHKRSKVPDIDKHLHPTQMSSEEYKVKQYETKQNEKITPRKLDLRDSFGG